MPRGRRKNVINPSEEIQIIDQKIADLQEQIAALKKDRKAAVARADEAAKQKVIDAFIASGKTADEFLAGINAEAEN
ncbi:MAG TPA: hypothetical protein IAA51_05900 [Candidatus Cottocaccamicrobium excrementipullorum]|nr:hypothetical protein [Candidatus Cottocaccamicrobium excrementipullorum]